MLNDLDFEPRDWTRKKEKKFEKTIACTISKDICSDSVYLAASINDISPTKKVVTSVVYKAGGDVSKLHCCISAASSDIKKVNLIINKQARNDIKAALKASKYPPSIHFDGKTLFELKKVSDSKITD